MTVAQQLKDHSLFENRGSIIDSSIMTVKISRERTWLPT
jgi:hypothetical protein